MDRNAERGREKHVLENKNSQGYTVPDEKWNHESAQTDQKDIERYVDVCNEAKQIERIHASHNKRLSHFKYCIITLSGTLRAKSMKKV